MPRESARQVGRARTGELRREIDRAQRAWAGAIWSRTFGLGLLVWVAFVLLAGTLVAWTREQPLVAVGRVMHETRTVRAAFDIVDEAETEELRRFARRQAPRVYVGNAALFEQVRESLARLPAAIKDAESVEAVDPTLRQQFGITEEALAALKRQVVDGRVVDSWESGVRQLVDLELGTTPILEEQTYQVETASPNNTIELRTPGRPVQTVRTRSAINVADPQLPARLREMAREAGFRGVLQDVVVAQLVSQIKGKPTFTFDGAATAAVQEAEAARVEPRKVTYPDREVIYRRGDVLTPLQRQITEEAIRAERAQLGAEAAGGWGAWANAQWKLWAPRLAALGLAAAVGLALAGYTALFCPKIRRNPVRMGAVALLLAGTAVVACWGTAAQPGLIALTAVAPTVFVAVILAVAYDQRVALAYAALHGVLVCAALDAPAGLFAVMIAGIGVGVWQLKEVRDRDALIRMGMYEAVVLAAGMFVVTVLELPMSRQALEQAGWDAGLAGFGGLLVAGVALFLLPSMERAFDITTGMTLIELRDPKQPLLRQLQQRAPGTYNHSLNLASMAEAASEAIGANGLLAYVGALYHDIGKMNKPDYFVENQVPGFNKHDRLNPAMSLLIIVGHVKDGMELAREYGLPRPLHHFIESHHGATLVEYFFHRARKQAAEHGAAGGGGASGDAAPAPTELEYRYPGPKPRTKEAAIVMLCDAVESAARAMADPTPARIDATVRAIATKRLMDGQFDECDITLRDLNVVVETVSKTLASIYHGRIAYPTGPSESQPQTGSRDGPAAASRPMLRDERGSAASGGAPLSGMPPVLRAGSGSARGPGVSVRRE